MENHVQRLEWKHRQILIIKRLYQPVYDLQEDLFLLRELLVQRRLDNEHL